MRKPVFGVFLTRFGTNEPAQLQKMARVLNFGVRMKKDCTI